MSDKHKVLLIEDDADYPNTAAIRQRDLEPGMAFIQKPFSPGALARKVREVLNAPPKEGQ